MIKYYVNHPNKVFWHIMWVLLIGLMCHTPIVIRATQALFQQIDDEIYPWNRGRHVWLMPIRASARPMAAFSGFYESHELPSSGDAPGIVPSHRNVHRNGQQSGHMMYLCFVCCCPGGRRGNTEPVVARWRCPVASGEILVMLHIGWCRMYHFNASVRPSKWAATEMHLFVALRTMLWSIWTNAELGY